MLLFGPSANRPPMAMDLLIFDVGGPELFAMDVFKLAEVVPQPRIAMGDKGAQVSLRGAGVVAVDAGSLLGASPRLVPQGQEAVALVCVYNGRRVAYVVRAVEAIARVEGAAPIAGRVELPGGRQAKIVDWGTAALDWAHTGRRATSGGAGFYANASECGSRQIQGVFDAIGVSASHADDAPSAWEKLEALARGSSGPLNASLRVILIEAELPPVDGYDLASRIRADRRFDGVPIAMHSSWISRFNIPMARAAGVDRYATHFDAASLTEAILGPDAP